MSRKSNPAVVQHDEPSVEDERQADIETDLMPYAGVERAEQVGDPQPDPEEPIAATKKARKTRAPRAAYIGGEIEDDVPAPSRLIKHTLAELIEAIPAGKSRVIIGTKPAGVMRAAKAGGFEIVTGEVDGQPDSVRVWRV